MKISRRILALVAFTLTLGIAFGPVLGPNVAGATMRIQMGPISYFGINPAATHHVASFAARPAATGLSLSASTTNASTNQSVTLTATLKVSSGSAGGVTVTFYNGSTSLGTATTATTSLTTSTATLTTTFSTVGSYSLHATTSSPAYTSSNLTETVSAPAPTSISLSASSTSVAVGGSYTLTATVAPTSTVFSVAFKSGTTTVATVNTTSGVATYTVTNATAGSVSYTATAGTRTSTSVTVSVTAPSVSSISLSGPSTATTGSSYTLTATVSPNTSVFSVAFKSGTTTVATVNTSSGVATYTVTNATAGTFSYTATAGTKTSSTLRVSVTAPTVTGVALAASAGPYYVGTPFTLSATLTPTLSGQTVTFKSGSTTVGSATSNGSGVATLTVTPSATGSFSYTATSGSKTSTAVSVSVSTAPLTAISLTAPSTGMTGVAETLTATTTPAAAGYVITFYDGATSLGTATTNSSGVATKVTTPSTTGDHVFEATGSGATQITSNTATTTVSAATNNGIDYHGGTVMNTVDVYTIFYGNWSTKSTPQSKTIITNFLSSIGGTGYFNINSTYYDSYGNVVPNHVVLAGSVNVTSYSTSLSDNDVANVVASEIGSGALPYDPNGIYFVLTSSDVQETSGFLSSYCGWHTYYTSGSQDVKFSFVGDPSRGMRACSAQSTHSPNGDPAADAMVSVIAHELSETVSDPHLDAWYQTSTGSENGDLCAWNFGAYSTLTSGANAGAAYNVTWTYGGTTYNYLIQQMWLNANGGGCYLSYP